MDATTQIVAVNCTQLLGLVHKLWYFAGNEVKRNLGTTILLSPTFCHSQQAMKAKRNWLQLYFHHNEIDCLNLIMGEGRFDMETASPPPHWRPSICYWRPPPS